MRTVFTRREHILEYLQISEHIYAKFIRLGMPVLVLDGRVYAHKENIDLFFRTITATNAKNSVEGSLQNTPQNGGKALDKNHANSEKKP